ncbi:ABC transporter permease [Ilumatobacter nonamiensis]|uniref:ABC transporter permease n=1 Tax=Ilumatobacter nonamiensis TaxID=467093 RepID=UPI000347286F|nr:ABC transporter permease [Ilumatobacter nonamiensis]
MEPLVAGGSTLRLPRSLKRVMRVTFGSVVVLLSVSVVTFLLLHLMPGDPAIAILGEDATADRLEAVRDRLGLDEPLPAQFGQWLANLARGDLGQSLFSSQTVMTALSTRLPVTISVTLAALAFALAVSIPAGVIAATHPGGWIDRAVSLGAAGGVALPSYFIGSLLIVFLALKTDLLPATGYSPPSDGLGAWALGLVLPGITLGVAAAAEITRQLRGALRDVLRTDYIRTARAAGNSPRVVVWKYAMKNAAVPLVTVVGFQIAALLSGSVIVEQIFGIPGLGSLAVTSVLQRDIPMVQGLVLVTATIVVITNLLVDTAVSVLNVKGRV